MTCATGQRLRILLWYWGRRGGGAQFTLGLARALARRQDVDLRLLISAQADLLEAFRALPVPVQTTSTYTDVTGFLLSLLRLRQVEAELRSAAQGADVIVSGMPHLWTPLLSHAIRRLNVAYVPAIHDVAPHPGDPALLWNWRLQRELDSARAVIALSDAVARALHTRAPALPIIQIPLLATFVDGGASGTPRSNRFNFLFFGRFRDYKGLDILRDAFAIVRTRHPEATLRVIGQGDIERCAKGLSSMPGVTVEPRWVGETEIGAVLQTADTIVLPYREASQSGVIPQALALGIPVIVTPVGGLAEQVQPGLGGVIADAANAAAFADAMSETLTVGALDRLRREAMSASPEAADWDNVAATVTASLRALVLPGG